MIEWSDQKVEESEVGWVSPDLKMYKFRIFFRRFFVHPMMAIFGVFGVFGVFGGVFFTFPGQGSKTQLFRLLNFFLRPLDHGENRQGILAEDGGGGRTEDSWFSKGLMKFGPFKFSLT